MFSRKPELPEDPHDEISRKLSGIKNPDGKLLHAMEEQLQERIGKEMSAIYDQIVGLCRNAVNRAYLEGQKSMIDGLRDMTMKQEAESSADLAKDGDE